MILEYLGAFAAALLICSCAALAIASWFTGEVKHTPVKPSLTWLPWRKDIR